uniref:Uncharacterized protein n=1 Tax=Sphaerodactylus townsendi TaxID=933632 RepID=A0ACB8E5T3_9SAUR
MKISTKKQGRVGDATDAPPSPKMVKEEEVVKVKLEEDEEEEEEAGYIQSGRRYKCLTCGKTFPSVPRVLRHLKTHTASAYGGSVSELICPNCRREFPDRAQLRKHQLSHQTERPHQCPLCTKAYKTAPGRG